MHTHSLTHAFPQILKSPKRQQGIPAAVAHPLHPPSRGRRCPRGNRGLWSHLKRYWIPCDPNSPLLLLGVLSWAPGPGRRQAQTLRPLLGEQREALLSPACPPAQLLVLSEASPQAMQVRGAGEARAWQRGLQGHPRRGCSSVVSPLGEPGPWGTSWSQATFPFQAAEFCSSFSQSLTARGLLEQPGLGGSLLSSVVTSSAPKDEGGLL